MKINKSLIIAIAAVSAVTATSAYSQTRSNVRAAQTSPIRQAPQVAELTINDLKIAQKTQIKSLSRELEPQVQRAIERKGMKASRAQVTEASDKIAAFMINSNIDDLTEKMPGISIKVNIKLSRPVEISVEVKF